MLPGIRIGNEKENLRNKERKKQMKMVETEKSRSEANLSAYPSSCLYVG